KLARLIDPLPWMLRQKRAAVLDGVINPRCLELSRVSSRFVIACQRHKNLGSRREPTGGDGCHSGTLLGKLDRISVGTRYSADCPPVAWRRSGAPAFSASRAFRKTSS